VSQKGAKVKADQRRKRGILVGLILLGGMLLVGAFAIFRPQGGENPGFTPQVSGSPSLKVDQESIDFGDVKLGTPVEAVFTLTNVGDAALRFTDEPYIQLAAGC
jgi:hypothetical protein